MGTFANRPVLKPNRRPWLALFCCLIFPLWTQAKLNVVGTTADLAAIAAEIGGDRVTLSVLAKPTEDPHFVDARPSFIVKVNRADALIEGGAELESAWLKPLVDGARNAKLLPGAPGRISCAQGVAFLDVPAALDRSRGDIHAMGNPHYVVDPGNVRIVAGHMAEAFCRLDAGSCAVYRGNLEKFLSRLDQKLVEWKKALEPFRGTRLVAYHNNWPYFAQQFGLRIDLFLEPKPGIPPTPSHLAQVMGAMKRENIPGILVEPFQNRRTAERVAGETGANVIEVSQYPGGLKGAASGYFDWMDALVAAVARGLKND